MIWSSAFVFATAKMRFIYLICNFLHTILLKKKHFDCLRGSIMTHLRKFVSSVPEYRRTSRGNFKHKLEDILMLVLLGRLSKCITRAEILQFGKHHLKRLQAKGLFPYGLPSEATLCRVFQSIDDEKMADRMSAFADFFRKEISTSATDIICIDGKAMRGTLYENGRNPDIVSAYSLRSGFTLATDVCTEKSNEIKSVPRLLDKLDVSGCVVTVDAMSFQKVIIDRIRDKGSDFVIELKANQRSLRYDFLKKHYPDGEYHAVYESGFSGFSTYYALQEVGIDCIVIHAADVPTTQYEETMKTDKVDAVKLVKSLKAGLLTGIYIHKRDDIDARAVVRLRKTIQKQLGGYKSRVKHLLHSNGWFSPNGFPNLAAIGRKSSSTG